MEVIGCGPPPVRPVRAAMKHVNIRYLEMHFGTLQPIVDKPARQAYNADGEP
jgi:hypothetical protein